jgi:hypothetical protein
LEFLSFYKGRQWLEKEPTEYENEWDFLSLHKMRQEQVRNAYRLAGALRKIHFKYLEWSLGFLMAGLIGLILFLLTPTVFPYLEDLAYTQEVIGDALWRLSSNTLQVPLLYIIVRSFDSFKIHILQYCRTISILQNQLRATF